MLRTEQIVLTTIPQSLQTDEGEARGARWRCHRVAADLDKPAVKILGLITCPSTFVQDRPQALPQIRHAERLFDDRKFLDRLMPFQHVPRVARGKQDLDTLVQSPGFPGHLDAIDAVWHHDVT